MVIGNKLVKIYLSINNKDKKYEKNAKYTKFPLVFFLEFSKKRPKIVIRRLLTEISCDTMLRLAKKASILLKK